MSRCLAVDLGGTKLAAALIENDVIVEKFQTETLSSNQPEQLKDRLKQLLFPLASRADKVAVASTGIINNGVLTALNPNNLGGLNQFPLHNVISEITGLPTTVINDAQAAAWAEYQAYDAYYKNMAFITISTGVGAGLIINGKLQTGTRGIAGHAGHMLADPNGSLCGCGRVGCVEAIASGTAIGLAGNAFLGEGSTGQAVYQAYLDGNAEAEKIISRSAFIISNLIADLTISLDLDAVILGGSVGLAKNYLSLVKKHLSLQPEVYQPKVLPALEGVNAGLIGVAKWVK